MLNYKEYRWALVKDFKGIGLRFLGKYCWPDATDDEPDVRTFRTRLAARNARNACCYRRVKIVKVSVEAGVVPNEPMQLPSGSAPVSPADTTRNAANVKDQDRSQ